VDKETLIDILEFTIFIGLVYILTVIVFVNFVDKLIHHEIPTVELLFFILLCLYAILFNACWWDNEQMG
jgi:hypothetical protein